MDRDDHILCWFQTAGSVGETGPEPLGPDRDQSGSEFVCGDAEFQGQEEDWQLQTGFWTVVD